MTLVRKLTDIGTERFRAYITALKQGSQEGPPVDLLTDPDASAPIIGTAEVEHGRFKTRFEAAQYFESVFAGIDRAQIDHVSGLWNWLSLYYFDELCPPAKGGSRKPGKEYRYVLPPVTDPNHHYRYYRHLLAGAWTVYKIHSRYIAGPQAAQTLLSGPVDTFNDYNEQLASRQDFIANPGLIQAVDLLYFDTKKGIPKRGAAPNKPKPGTLRRFVSVIQQFDRTFDLYSMKAKDIVALLPAEFGKYARP